MPFLNNNTIQYGLLMLLISAGVCFSQIPSGSGNQAMFRFRVEPDTASYRIPDQFLSDTAILPKLSSRDHRWFSKRREAGLWLNSRIHSQGLGCSVPSRVVYDLSTTAEIDRFVARIGPDSRSQGQFNITFEVHADDQLLYQSRPLKNAMASDFINVKIPSGSRRLTLVISGRASGPHPQANWVDAGFTLRNSPTRVSKVTVWPTGYDPESFVVVMADEKGAFVHSDVLWARMGDPMDILFDSSRGGRFYYVYLIDKSQYKGALPTWQPPAGLVLETRRAVKYDTKIDTLYGMGQLWAHGSSNPVGKSLAESIHLAAPIHPLAATVENAALTTRGLGLYYFTGYFNVDQPGEYTFATASDWSSFLLVDAKRVATWEGRHNYRAGRRGQKQGTVRLKAGIHKLEYLNNNTWGKMVVMAAWQRPGDSRLKIMTRSDFLPVGGYGVTEVFARQPGGKEASFCWTLLDDLRWDVNSPAMVSMNFSVVKTVEPAEKPVDSDLRYQWHFDDGSIATGDSIEHIFLTPGLRPVTLKVFKGNNLLAERRQVIHVHALGDKLNFPLNNLTRYDKAITARDLSGATLADLIQLYHLADTFDRPAWKARAAETLAGRVDELLGDPQWRQFSYDLGEEMRSYRMKRYDQALDYFAELGKRAGPGTLIRHQALLAEAEILTGCFGRAQEALSLIEEAEKETGMGKSQTAGRRAMIKAEAMTALGQVDPGCNILELAVKYATKALPATAEIKHISMLNHARQLAENRSDPAQLDHAMAQLQEILTENPGKILWPDLNLVRLDIYLARQEFLLAYHLSGRMEKLNVSEYYRPEVLLGQVKALCGLGELKKARAAYQTLNEKYPYSPALPKARQAIVKVAEAVLKE